MNRPFFLFVVLKPRDNSMYCPTLFREQRLEKLHEIIKKYPLAMLITSGENRLTANLIPFTLDPIGEYGTLHAHLARGNRQLKDLQQDTEVLVVFQGPAAYVSPSWYPSKADEGKVVPTWNFVMVQARGKARLIENADWLQAQIGQLTDQQEQTRPHPWRVNDAPEAFVEQQLKGIVGVEIPISQLEGKWKISQNRTVADQEGVIAGLSSEGISPEMVEWMQRED